MASGFTTGLSKIPAPQRVLLAALFLVLCGVLYYFLRYQSRESTLREKDEQMAAARSALARAVAEYRDYEQLTRDLEAARSDLERLNKLLPTNRDIEGLMTRINAQAKDSRLRLTNIVPLDEKEAEYYIRIPIRIDFRGTFHQLLHFLHLVDTGVQRLVNIENIHMARTPSAEEPNVIQGTVLATTFMAKEPGSGQPSGK